MTTHRPSDISRREADPCVVLIGLDTLQGLQAARILRGHGARIIALAMNPGHPACRTNACAELIVCDTHGPGLIAQLSRVSESLSGPAALLPCHDSAVADLSRNRGQLSDRFRMVLPDPDVVETLMDKDRFHEFAARHQFNVPALRGLNDRAEAERAAEEMAFPCIVKPTVRTALWNARTAAKAFLVESAKEFLGLYDEIHDWCDTLVIQEVIPGDESNLYSCNCYFDRSGRLRGSFIARKLRQWPPRTGSSCLGEEVRNDAVKSESLRLFETVGYRGLGYLEMKRDPRTDQYYLIEANVGRPTGRSAIAEAGGVDLLWSMVCDVLDLPFTGNLTQRYTGVRWWDFRHDVQSALFYFRNGELSLGQWLRSIKGKKAHAIFSWRDPLPFVFDCFRVFKLALSRKERLRRSSAFPDGRKSSNG